MVSLSIDTSSTVHPPYQVGGSLSPAARCYVERQADRQLYTALTDGQFCYVLNSRQMGKSSLMVHTLHALQQAGYRCTTIDITSIGSEQTTPEQWYRGIMVDLWRGFQLFDKVHYKTWWQDQGNITPVQKLQRFIDEVLLTHFPTEQLIIFIDEIDSILSLRFSLDDFFGLIRFCYNQRAVDPQYERLTFAIFGVATPADLMRDRQRTPFNIGQAIALQGFQWEECQPLLAGLAEVVEHAPAVLRAILEWTGGQPFLTQKLCALVWQTYQETAPSQFAKPKAEVAWVEQLVSDRIIHQWEFQDEPEHLRTIRNRLLRRSHSIGRLLGLYQRIWQHGQIAIDASPEQTELLLSGLVVKAGPGLQVGNPIYCRVFDLDWVNHHLQELRPYSQTFDAWIAANCQDFSRLLRGQALRDAQSWAQGKRLSDEDYQFLAASAEHDRQEVQRTLEAERASAIAIQLEQTQRNARLQRWLLGVCSAGFFVASGLGIIAFQESQRAVQNEQLARQSEVTALAASAQAWFSSQNRLQGMMQAIRAYRQLEQSQSPDPAVSQQVEALLRKIIFGISEANQFIGHQSTIKAVAYRPNGRQIASASIDGTVKLWHPDGTLFATLPDHTLGARSLSYSPQGNLLATGGGDGAIYLWNPDTGERLTTIKAHNSLVTSLAFSPDGQVLASGGTDNTVKLWRSDGTPIQTLTQHQAMVRSLAFSPDGELLASASADQTINLWHPQTGRLLSTLTDHTATVTEVVFSPDGRYLASASADSTVRLWTLQGKLLKTFEGHRTAVTSVQFSPDSRMVVSTSDDHEVKFWQITGEPILAYTDMVTAGSAIAFSPDGQQLVSSGQIDDRVLVLWQLTSPFYSVISGHQAAVLDLALSPVAGAAPQNQQQLASAGADGTIKLWQSDGELLTSIQGHRAPTLGVAFSPFNPSSAGANPYILVSGSMDGAIRLWGTDGTSLVTYGNHQSIPSVVVFQPIAAASSQKPILASGDTEGDIHFWQRDGQEISSFKGHQGAVVVVAWHPQGHILATGGVDNLVKFWDPENGSLLHTLAGHTGAIRDLAFSADGKLLVTASEDGTARLWDTTSNELITTFTGHEDTVRAVAFSPPGVGPLPDQPIVASAGFDKTINLWTLDGTLLTTLERHTSKVHSVVFSEDGRFLYSASSDKTIIQWNLDTVLQLDPIEYACNWVSDYLQNNSSLTPEDRQICDSGVTASRNKFAKGKVAALTP
jgi:WD40 repeat protein